MTNKETSSARRKIRIKKTIVFGGIFFICLYFYSLIFVKPSGEPPAYLVKTSRSNQLWPDSFYVSVSEAKRFIPDGAHVEMSPRGFNIYRIFAKYMLYPIELKKDWAYFIDFSYILKPERSRMRSFDLSTGVRIYMKPGYALLTEPKKNKRGAEIKVWAIFFAVCIVNVCIGIIILQYIRAYQPSMLVRWLWGAGYLIFFFLMPLSVWMFLILGGTIEQNALLILWVLTSYSLFIFARRTRMMKSRSLFGGR